MTTEPKASLGRDGAKRSAPDCWTWLSCGIRFYAQPGEDRPDHATALNAAPVLPVEVRDALRALIDADTRLARAVNFCEPTENTDELTVAEGESRAARNRALAILSTITGDA